MLNIDNTEPRFLSLHFQAVAGQIGRRATWPMTTDRIKPFHSHSRNSNENEGNITNHPKRTIPCSFCTPFNAVVHNLGWFSLTDNNQNWKGGRNEICSITSTLTATETTLRILPIKQSPYSRLRRGRNAFRECGLNLILALMSDKQIATRSERSAIQTVGGGQAPKCWKPLGWWNRRISRAKWASMEFEQANLVLTHFRRPSKCKL